MLSRSFVQIIFTRLVARPPEVTVVCSHLIAVASTRTGHSCLGGENINDTGIYFSQCGLKFHSMEITTVLHQNKICSPTIWASVLGEQEK